MLLIKISLWRNHMISAVIAIMNHTHVFSKEWQLLSSISIAIGQGLDSDQDPCQLSCNRTLSIMCQDMIDQCIISYTHAMIKLPAKWCGYVDHKVNMNISFATLSLNWDTMGGCSEYNFNVYVIWWKYLPFLILTDVEVLYWLLITNIFLAELKVKESCCCI